MKSEANRRDIRSRNISRKMFNTQALAGMAGITVSILCSTSVLAAAAQHKVNIDLDPEEQQAKVYVRGEHFTTYQFGDDTRIPHLWPMHAENGMTITRNYPLGEDQPVTSTDHPHHKSFWTAFGDVNGYDHWHNEPIVTQNVEAGSGDAYGWIRAKNVWPDRDGEPIVDETREYRFYDTPASARIFDHMVTFTASYGDVTFGDDKEGLVAFRIRPEIQGNEAGVLTNSEGQQGERAVYGTPGPWMDYSGPIEGAGQRGIALFSHPSNLRQPAWHVRDYGLVAANPFAMSDVAGLDDGTYVLEEGESLTFIFRAYIHTGDVEEADVAGHYAAFAEEAEAELTGAVVIATPLYWHGLQTIRAAQAGKDINRLPSPLSNFSVCRKSTATPGISPPRIPLHAPDPAAYD